EGFGGPEGTGLGRGAQSAAGAGPLRLERARTHGPLNRGREIHRSGVREAEKRVFPGESSDFGRTTSLICAATFIDSEAWAPGGAAMTEAKSMITSVSSIAIKDIKTLLSVGSVSRTGTETANWVPSFAN